MNSQHEACRKGIDAAWSEFGFGFPSQTHTGMHFRWLKFVAKGIVEVKSLMAPIATAMQDQQSFERL